VNFALDYLLESDVTCRVGNETDGSGAPQYRAITFLTTNLIQVGGAPAGNGIAVTFDRTVDKSVLRVDYNNGDQLDEDNLMIAQKQAMMAVHEVLDGRISSVFTQDINMGGYSVVNLREPVASTDAATKAYVDNTAGAAAATAAEAAAAEAAGTLADVTGVAADVDADRVAAEAARAAAETAASVLNSAAHQYDNRAAAAAATIPTGVNVIRTYSYASFGDGGSQTLQAVVSDPGDGGKLVSANGRWFKAIEDGLIVDPRRYGVKCRGAIDGVNDTAAWQEAFSKVPPYGAIYVPPSIQGSLISGTGAQIFLIDKPINIVGAGHASAFITDSANTGGGTTIIKATTTQDIDWRQAEWSSFKIANYQSAFYGNPVDYVPGAPITPTRAGAQGIWLSGGTTNGGMTRMRLRDLFIGQSAGGWSIAIDGGVTVSSVYTPVVNRMLIDGCEIFGGLLFNAVADGMKVTNSSFGGSRGVQVDFSTAGQFTFTENTIIAPANIVILGGTTCRIVGNYMEEIAGTSGLKLDDIGARAFVDISGANSTASHVVVAENLINVLFSNTAVCIRDDNALGTIVRDNRMTVHGSQYHWAHNGNNAFKYPNIYSTGNAISGSGTFSASLV
jgi:hypothetical protein